MIENAEFYLQGDSTVGVLLIHGLTGTPKEMRFVGRGLHRAGHTVLGMQLAGHCGDEDDLRATVWQDWYASVEAAAQRLLAVTDRIFVAGLSMGALLALRYAAYHPERILGVGVYGPTFRYDGWSIPLYARYLYPLLRVVQFFGIWQDKHFAEQEPYGLKDERLRALISSSMQAGDSAAAGLAGNPYPSLAEMLKLAACLKRELPQVTAPCLIIHARHDDVADISNSRLVERRVSGPTHFVILENSYHMITIDLEHKQVIRESADFIAAQAGLADKGGA